MQTGFLEEKKKKEEREVMKLVTASCCPVRMATLLAG